MDFNMILDRFKGSNFIVYDGNETILNQVKERGTVNVWYTRKADMKTDPIRGIYTDFLKIIDNAIYVIIGSGNAGGSCAEDAAYRIFRDENNEKKIIIFHGYSEFVITPSSMVKQIYSGGSVVASIYGESKEKIVSLQHLMNLLKPQISIPVPLKDSDILSNNDIKDVLPYIHIWTRIKKEKSTTGIASIPLTDDMPTDVLTMSKKKQMDYDFSPIDSVVSWGQRKLLMAEIELLTEISSKGKGFIFVYIGAAPGEGKQSHIPFLLGLFLPYEPIFHLWDRRNRLNTIKESSNIRIIPSEFEDKSMIGDSEGFFTDAVAQRYLEKYGKDNKIVLISDIRDVSTKEAIKNDMEMQQRWVEVMQPYASHLKFRIPENNESYSYLDGNILTQAWARMKSSETRLLSYRPYAKVIYNGNDYSRSMAYFNNITRMNSYNMGKIANIPGRYIHDIEDGLCTCHDCAREIQIIARYLTMRGQSINEKILVNFVRAITKSTGTTRSLWVHTAPQVGPGDRKMVLLFKKYPTDIVGYQKILDTAILWAKQQSSEPIGDVIISDDSLDNLSITNIGRMLVYADDISADMALSYLLDKKPAIPLIVETEESATFASIIQGKKYPIVVDFHTDFIRNYNPAEDKKGITGRIQYELFLRDYKISGQKRDIWNHLLLYVFAHMNIK